MFHLFDLIQVPCLFIRCNNQTTNSVSSVQSDITSPSSTTPIAADDPITNSTDALSSTTTSIEDLITFNSLIGVRSYYFSSASSDTTIKLWYLNNGTLMTELTGHKGAINCLINVGNGIIVSGSADHTIKIWFFPSSSVLYEFNNTNGGHTDEVSSLAFINFDLIASASWDKTVKVWDLTTYSLKFTFDNSNGGHTSKVNCLSLLKNGLLASGSSDSSVKVWDPINGTLMFNFNSSNGGYSSSIVQLLSFSNEILVANANNENILKVWDLNSTNNSLINSFDSSINHTLGYFTAIEATNNPLLVAGLSYGGIKVWDPIYNILFYNLDGTYGYNSSIDLLYAIPSGFFPSGYIPSGLFAAANGLYEIRIYDTYSGLEMFRLTGHTNKITSIVVAHNGDLISGSLDGAVRVWSTATWTLKYFFNNQNGGHTGSITALVGI